MVESNLSVDLMPEKTEYLVEVIQRLSLAKSLEEITEVVRHAARELVDADGATFVLRDEDRCHYVDEEAIGPLWKGKKFPLNSCISGWAMLHNEVAISEDIYKDDRIPHSAYRPTFVQSLVMTPIRGQNPIGAIGTYWANHHQAQPSEVKLLKALANSTSIALENVRIVSDLKKTNDALSESVRSRDEFLSVAAHELRTPLSALKLQLQMTQREVEEQPTDAYVTNEMPDDLSMALRQTDKLGHLIEQLLDISRIRLDKLDLGLSDFGLDDAVRTVVDHLSPHLKEASCEVKLNLAPVRGHWDRLRIEQVISNLISNACKYAGGQPIEITVQADGHDAVLSVADHGSGIAQTLHNRIFERFVRGISADHVSGLGLGLFIVRSIVRAHLGEVTVANAGEGKGAVFTVRLPLDPFLVKEAVRV